MDLEEGGAAVPSTAPAVVGRRRPSGRIVVMSGEQLIRDAVRVALRGLGFTAASVAVPSGPAQFHDLHRWIANARPATGLLLAEIDNAARLREAVAVLGNVELPWLVLTGTPSGPAWGAVVDAGAVDVLSTSGTLGDLATALRRLAAGRQVVSPELAASVRAWERTADEQRRLARHLEALSAREMEVLVALHEGSSVRVIAERAGVTEGTVRSQVKAVLRKLDVKSQLQAVAAFRRANEWLGA
jgi:DNA-binding NarL/FixJ family response regulator